MAVTNLYPNLPGHLVEFKDGGLQLTSDNAANTSGKSLLILGTAFDGPINEPVKIDATTVSQLFGSDVNEKGYPNGATLTKYAKQAFKNGFTDVRCMRVTGSLASTKLIKKRDENALQIEEIVNAYAEGVGGADVKIALPIETRTQGPIAKDGAGNLRFTVHETIVNASGGYNAVGVETVGPFSTNALVCADRVRKGTGLAYQYFYKKYEAFTIDSIDPSVCVDADTAHSLGLADGEQLFSTANDYEGAYAEMTIGSDSGDYVVHPADVVVKVDTVGGAVLVEGSDYVIANGKIYFPRSVVSAGETVKVTGHKFTLVESTGNVVTPVTTNQEIALPHKPVVGSVSVEANVGGETITVTEWYVSDTANGASLFIRENAALEVNAAIKVSYKYAETVEESLTVRSIYGGSVYKEASVQVKYAADNRTVIFVFNKPRSKKFTANEAPLVYSTADYPTAGYLKQALANTALNNVFEIVCDDDNLSLADFPLTTGAQALSEGGDDGVVVTNDQMYEALSGKRDAAGYLETQGAYQILENYNVDYIYPAGIYANSEQTVNPKSSFHHELALLCAVLTYRTKMTHGFIDMKPNANTTLVGIQDYVYGNKEKHIKGLLEYDNTHFMQDENGDVIEDAHGNTMDIGWYTSCVVGPEPVMVSDTLGTYYGSPAIAYAALNASIKPESAPTNKALPGVKGMKFKFSNKQMNELVANRMVVFKLKNEGTTTASSTPYVVDGCTSGAANSDYTRLSTVKVVSDVVDQVREVADPFIGEPNTIEQRNALAALISKRLGYLMEKGEITYYEFEINATVQQVLLGECSIALTLVCPMELRKITTVVALRAAA